MIRFARTIARALLALPLLAVLYAQAPDWNTYSQALHSLPASTFAKQRIGVRGMQLAVVNKLDPRLRDVVDQARQGNDVRTRSLELGATRSDPRLPVMANSADARRAAALVQEIRNQGGEISATYDTTVWALLPSASIDRVAASPNVSYLSVQDRMEQTQASGPAADGASLRATGVQALHKSGIRGRGVKIGIIDFGFGGYSRMQQAGKVPTPKMTRTFPPSFPLENDSVHGTACAEIIHEMAPEADIYLASADGLEGSVIAGARWLISQGVDIISYSAGSAAKPTDGTSEMDRFVDSTTTENGVVWIVSTGNSGTVHWSGKNKANSEGIIETGNNHEVGIEMVPKTDVLDITVRWNDWGPDPRQPTSSQDIDAYLLTKKADGSGLEMVAKSDHEQAGTGPPLEFIKYARKGIKGQHFLLVLKNAKVTRSLDVHVFVYHNQPADLAPETPAGSVLSPASASDSVGVGAWIPQTNGLAPYSSQGPTDDNRLKPEVTAPAGLPSAAYGEDFHGTSASCPHVAGFAALLKQIKPELKGLALRDAIIRAVEPKGQPVPNMASGYGWIDGGHVGLPGAAAPIAPVSPEDRPPVVRTSQKAVLLPMAWGGSVPADFLDRMRLPAGQTPEFLARVITGRDLYKVGDGLKVGFKASENCDYLLLHRSSTGEYTLLSPLGGTAGSLTAGAAHLLPDENETFEVTPPIGSEELLLLCSRRAVDLSAAAKDGKLPAGPVVARHRYQIGR